MLGYGLIAEEVFTVQAAAQLLQKTKDVVYTVYHRKAEKVLLPVKCGCNTASPDHLKSQYVPQKLQSFVCFAFGEEVNVKSY